MGFENGNVYTVVFKATKNGRDEVNVFHYDGDNNDDPQTNNGQSLADAVANDSLSWFKGLYDTSWAIGPVIVTETQDPQNPTAPRSQWQAGGQGNGLTTPSATPAASGAFVCVTVKTKHIGRRYTGRKFVGGSATEADINGNKWETPHIGAVATFVDSLPKQPDVAGPGSLATCKLSVYSRSQRAQMRDPYLSEVVSNLPHDEIHWLRRRANIG